MRTRSVRLLTLGIAAGIAAPVMLGLGAVDPGGAQDKGKLRFGVGPLQPTPTETKKAYEPFFAHVAKTLGRDFDLVATTDWAGISVALANGQVDMAWMGPWGYVLANNDSGVTPIATVKYDGKPIYHAIVVCRPDLPIKSWPEDAKGKRVSFADVGSMSGWLIRTAWFRTKASTRRSTSTTPTGRPTPRTRSPSLRGELAPGARRAEQAHLGPAEDGVVGGEGVAARDERAAGAPPAAGGDGRDGRDRNDGGGAPRPAARGDRGPQHHPEPPALLPRAMVPERAARHRLVRVRAAVRRRRRPRSLRRRPRRRPAHVGQHGEALGGGDRERPARPARGAAATGASRVKVLSFALVPDVAPSMVSIGLFWWEFNVRTSTVLGVVGAGGMGQELKNSMDLLDFPRLLTIIMLILAMVTIIDQGSQWLRQRLD